MVIPVTFSIDGWYFGNIFIGGSYRHAYRRSGDRGHVEDQDFINAELRENGQRAGTLEIIEIKDATPDMKDKMVKIG